MIFLKLITLKLIIISGVKLGNLIVNWFIILFWLTFFLSWCLSSSFKENAKPYSILIGQVMVNPVLVQLRHFLWTHGSHHRTRVYPEWESSHFIFTGWYSTQVYRYIFVIDSYRQLFINWYFVNILWKVVIQYYFCFYESQLYVIMLCFISLF